MYAGEDGEVCVELGYVGVEISPSRAIQPERSKVGGWPAWFGEVPVDVSDLICRLCGRCLYLIIQIYAPTHVQRSLCIFGCNQAACSIRPDGWRVVRTQASPQSVAPTRDNSDRATATGSSNKAGDLPPSLPVPPAAEPAIDAWGANADVSWDAAAAGDDGSDGWGAEEDEWGAEGGTVAVGGATVVDIEALLEEQEKKRSSEVDDGRITAEGLATGGVGTTPAEGRLDGGGDERKCAVESRRPDTGAPIASAVGKFENEGRGPSFPAKTVSFMPEPWGAEKVSAVEDKDMQKRLRKYREQEEDRGLVAALDQALGLNGGGGAGGSRQSGGGGGTAGSGEKYERTPARAKAVMRFADRVARSPHQVLRYAYGGQPLWSASDPPKEDTPPCACGAARVFEMQLMPALLLQLNVNDLAERETNGRRTENDKTCGSDGNRTSACTKPEVDGDKGCGESATVRPSVERGPEGVRQEDAGREKKRSGVRGQEEDEEGEEGNTKMPTPSAEERERLRTLGMDWGVVAVWSCPRSCEASHEECVVVQLPV